MMSARKLALLSVVLGCATWVVAQAAPAGGAAPGGSASPGQAGSGHAQPGQTSPSAPPTGNTGQPPTGSTANPPTGGSSTPNSTTPGSNPTDPNATNPNNPNSGTTPQNPSNPGMAPNGNSTNLGLLTLDQILELQTLARTLVRRIPGRQIRVRRIRLQLPRLAPAGRNSCKLPHLAGPFSGPHFFGWSKI